MNIDKAVKALGPVTVDPLREAVLDLQQEVWLLDQQRQQDFDVHRQTQSVVLVFCDGSRTDLVVERREGWDYLADAAIPVMEDLIRRHYTPGGTIIRAMAAKLMSGGRINPHFDSHATFRRSHRIHVPLTTNNRVRLSVDGRPYRFEVGQAYEINNQKVHSVINSGAEDRITFIFDYLPADFIHGRATA
jgi:aspartyl/asparaginyl beta-hydroxylase (cupin superfamily)